jgi:hypothetical protein
MKPHRISEEEFGYWLQTESKPGQKGIMLGDAKGGVPADAQPKRRAFAVRGLLRRLFTRTATT